MAFTFRPALPSEREGADHVLRAAFTPYLRRLGREIPSDYYKWLPASIERGDVFRPGSEAAGELTFAAADLERALARRRQVTQQEVVVVIVVKRAVRRDEGDAIEV